MFYFTYNESKIYESFTFWNKLQEKMNFFTIFKFAEMHLYIGHLFAFKFWLLTLKMMHVFFDGIG